MGMYTEFYFRAKVKDGEVADWLNQQVNVGEWFYQRPTFNHEFFTLPRWESVFIGGGAVYQESRKPIFRTSGKKHQNDLVIASSLKNYSGEIASFIDWITPHLHEHYGNFLGYELYEDSTDDTFDYREHPVLYFYGRDRVYA